MANTIRAGDIRAPQLVSMFGPGAIVNLRNFAVMPLSVDSWHAPPELESPTFARQIGAAGLVDAGAMSEVGVPAVLFPKSFVCRTCGVIEVRRNISQREADEGIRCPADSGVMYPSRWVVYCVRFGHIADFDYAFFLHRGADCHGQVRLRTGSSLKDTAITCDQCNLSRSMEEAYSKKAAGKCHGHALWRGEVESCDQPAKLTMRSASDVYFGAVRSAISIEPESNPVVRSVIAWLGGLKAMYRPTEEHALTELKKQAAFDSVPDDLLRRAVSFFFKAQEMGVADYRDRRRDEYDALSVTTGDPKEDLWTEALDATSLSYFGIAGITAVHRLREVRVLVGFSRGAPPADPAFDDVAPSVAPCRINKKSFTPYPAYENFGEGIFFRFDEVRLASWLERPAVRDRAELFHRAEAQWRSNFGQPPSEERRAAFILAHTFAHIVIREVSLHCGYLQSTIRERVLVSPDPADPWAGVLIYTASSDADGSLGGLVAQAKDGHISEILHQAMQSLAICSSDPVCALQEPIGYRRLNASACHACVVLPETSCERANRFLDRNLFVPNTLHAGSADLCYVTT